MRRTRLGAAPAAAASSSMGGYSPSRTASASAISSRPRSASSSCVDGTGGVGRYLGRAPPIWVGAPVHQPLQREVPAETQRLAGQLRCHAEVLLVVPMCCSSLVMRFLMITFFDAILNAS